MKIKVIISLFILSGAMVAAQERPAETAPHSFLSGTTDACNTSPALSSKSYLQKINEIHAEVQQYLSKPAEVAQIACEASSAPSDTAEAENRCFFITNEESESVVHEVYQQHRSSIVDLSRAIRSFSIRRRRKHGTVQCGYCGKKWLDAQRHQWVAIDHVRSCPKKLT